MKPAAPPFDDFSDPLRCVLAGHHHDCGSAALAADRLQCLDAAQVGKVEVQQHDIECVRLRQLQGLRAIRRIVELHAFEAIGQQALDAVAKQLVIVDDQDAQARGAGCCRGRAVDAHRREQAIAVTVDRLDHLLVAVAEDFSEPADALGEHGLGKDATGPHGAEQIVLVEDFPGVAQQHAQHFERLALDLDFLAVDQQLETSLVEDRVGERPAPRVGLL